MTLKIGHMKKFFLLTLLCFPSLFLLAQEEEAKVEEKGFKKENLFTGGSVALSFGRGTFLAGVNPVFGYSLNRWIDAGLAVNYVYTSQRGFQAFGDRVRQHLYGGGPFLRVFPVRFLFAQSQYEHNIIQQKYLSGNGAAPEKFRASSNSLLVGAGYTSGRVPGGSFYYLGVFFDALKDENSPYRDPQGRAEPVFRAGFHVPLFGGRRNRD